MRCFLVCRLQWPKKGGWMSDIRIPATMSPQYLDETVSPYVIHPARQLQQAHTTKSSGGWLVPIWPDPDLRTQGTTILDAL
jgi:hypothetical protein